MFGTWKGGDAGNRAAVWCERVEFSCKLLLERGRILLTEGLLPRLAGDGLGHGEGRAVPDGGTIELVLQPRRSLRHGGRPAFEGGRGRHRICMGGGHIIAGDRESGGS